MPAPPNTRMQSDRFVREIVAFLKSSRGALAAADAHSVGRACYTGHHLLSHAVLQEVAMTQVGHTLMGTALGILSLPAHTSPRWKVGYFAAFALLANLPDLPLPYWGHDRYDLSHSLFVNLLLSVLAVALCAWQPRLRQRVGGPAVLVTGMLAWLSHLLLDAFYNHGRGVAIFWPFSPASLALPIPWFSVVPFIPPITSAHVWEYGAEFASYFPLAVGAYVLRRKGILAQLVRACSGKVC